jgi:hypothetical protein
MTGALPEVAEAPPLEPPAVLAALEDGAGVLAAAALPLEADLSTPPCPLQAPRPPCAAVVPSLQVTGPLLEVLPLLVPVLVVCACDSPGAASSATASSMPPAMTLGLVIVICKSPRAL